MSDTELTTLREEVERLRGAVRLWEAEARHILADTPDRIVVREGGGMEDLRASLAVTVGNINRNATARASKAERERDEWKKAARDWMARHDDMCKQRSAAEARVKELEGALREARDLNGTDSCDGDAATGGKLAHEVYDDESGMPLVCCCRFRRIVANIDHLLAPAQPTPEVKP
jgi:hypothetical protein